MDLYFSRQSPIAGFLNMVTNLRFQKQIFFTSSVKTVFHGVGLVKKAAVTKMELHSIARLSHSGSLQISSVE